jgi:hypothetical protein
MAAVLFLPFQVFPLYSDRVCRYIVSAKRSSFPYGPARVLSLLSLIFRDHKRQQLCSSAEAAFAAELVPTAATLPSRYEIASPQESPQCARRGKVSLE